MRRKAFSLVEVLLIASIIALLLAVCLPLFKKASKVSDGKTANFSGMTYSQLESLTYLYVVSSTGQVILSSTVSQYMYGENTLKWIDKNGQMHMEMIGGQIIHMSNKPMSFKGAE
jgi:hypothetical protein